MTRLVYFGVIMLISLTIVKNTDATLIGTDLQIRALYASSPKLSETSDLVSLDSSVNNSTGFKSIATASLTGTLKTESISGGIGLDGGFAEAKAWFTDNIYNNNYFRNDYYLDLDYTFFLNPSEIFRNGCMTSTEGIISVLVNNVQIEYLGYDNTSWYGYDYATDTEFTNYSGPSTITDSHKIFLGYLDPGEFFTLEYSIYTFASSEEHFASNASSQLTASVSERQHPDPVPEPSTFILLGAGLGGIALYRRRMKK